MASRSNPGSGVNKDKATDRNKSKQPSPGEHDEEVQSNQDANEQIAELKELLQQSQQETEVLKQMWRESQAQRNRDEQEEKQIDPTVIQQQAALIAAVLQQQKKESESEFKLPTSMPTRLKYSEAKKILVLEDWLFDMKNFLAQAESKYSFKQALVKIVPKCWDPRMQQWYERETRTRVAENRPEIKDWEEMSEVITKFFISTGDEATALTQLKVIKMGANEEMVDYIQRCTEITNRISEERKSSSEKAELVLRGVSMERFEQTVLKILEADMNYREQNGNKGYDVDMMISALQKYAAIEPRVLKAQFAGEVKKKEPSYGSSTSTSNKGKKPKSSSNSNRSTTTNPTTQINNVRTEQRMFTWEEVQYLLSQREGSSADQSQMNALGKPGGNKGNSEFKCYNCQKPGHMARECPLPDRRVCKKCGVKGQHSTSKCPKGTEDTGSEGSKNE